MKLIVKTLKGSKFDIEVDESATVAQTKAIIEKENAEMPASSTKLIHSGKVLQDDKTLTEAGVKANDFLVVMVSKPKKPAAPPAAEKPKEPAPAPKEEPKTPASPAPAPAAPPAAPEQPAVPEEAVQGLVAMGFPEAEVRHCLRAAHGNPDIAVEFLTNGIPDGVAQLAGAVGGSASPAASSGQPLQALRNHPQFDQLRRLVQSNPQMLQQVLAQIGQQQPELLQEINANQALFLQMMNEPIDESSSPAPAPSRGSPGGFGGGLGSPAQMAQMINSMPPDQLDQMAQMMGLSVDQLRQTAQMIGSMPPEQIEQMMGAMGGLGGGDGGGQVLRLTEEEMAAVDRLAEMGFDRSEAAQAFLACDKNEALAANLLMDSMGDGGGAFGFDDGDNADGNDDDDDQNDDMQE